MHHEPIQSGIYEELLVMLDGKISVLADSLDGAVSHESEHPVIYPPRPKQSQDEHPSPSHINARYTSMTLAVRNQNYVAAIMRI